MLHLHGAKALISAFASKVIEYPLSFLFELYDFLCCITTITSNKSPYAPSSDQSASVLLRTRTRRRGIHPLSGIARDLYTSLNSINKLAARRTGSYGTATEKAKFLAEGRDIELCLQGWTPPEEQDDPRDLREVTAAALAIQWAALMRLHQVMHGNDVISRKVQTAVENILSALSIIRPGSQVEAHILFPLFMAGIGSTSKANRLNVEYRLNIMETTIGFGNIIGAHKLLDCVWQRMNEGQLSVDWELLMQTEYAGIVLL
jgi:transcriptional activator protein UGA3